jgi:hypothetical protein
MNGFGYRKITIKPGEIKYFEGLGELIRAIFVYYG